ncbi:hypothetical protein Hbor_18100 [Halogeometricum borinquense DSM 11551]|uniref:Uncharacterized protein n=1 Tax=Halogeometricum borinquense (strain ATCC 700274 / DSM 11551 / JCM 10706 / KCTC 4070 / PR3) TaxID=469382 RepID=E4NMW5_HALBP|nr:hypothetical protein Hbor_18100 [Halogeometricum borinquense DSM 11551]
MQFVTVRRSVTGLNFTVAMEDALATDYHRQEVESA